METVNATFPTNVQPAKFAFRFNKDEMGNQRAKVELDNVPVPSLNGIKEILEKPTVAPADATEEQKKEFEGNKAEQELLLEAMYNVFRDQYKEWVQASEDNNATTFKALTWRDIATMPKEDRRSSSIPKELWEGFGKDYAEVMAAVAGRTKEQIASALAVFQKKFSPVKTNKPVIKFLQGQMALYLEHTKNGEQYVDIIDMLVKKAEALLEDKSTEGLIGNLGM
jgi:hypothetical protein